MVKKFQRTKEDFTCEHCGEAVAGDGYTNHCPKCLYSKHVDIFPGDRLEECLGLMTPVAIEEKKSVYRLTHRCQKCGYEKVNTITDNDSRDALYTLAKRLAEKNSGAR